MQNRKKIVLMTLATSAVVTLLVLNQSAWSGQDHVTHKLEGAWIGKVPGTDVQWTYTMAPTDSSGRRATIFGSLQVRIPSWALFPGVLPEADYVDNFVGENTMTGPNTARFTVFGHGIKKLDSPTPYLEKVAFMFVGSGNLTYTGPGKAEVAHNFAFYLPEADGDGDGLPDPGQTPLLCLPTTSVDTRVGLIPPCTP